MSENTQTQEAAVAQEIKVHPNTEAMKVAFDNRLDWRQVEVRFKKTKDPETGIEIPARPSFSYLVPLPSLEGIAEILTTESMEKERRLLLDACFEVAYDRLRSLISDKQTSGADKIDAESIDPALLSWNVLANLTSAEKKASGIAKETWDTFQIDYVETICRVLGKEKEKAAAAAKVTAGKFAAVKGRKPIIKALLGQLEVWFQNTTKAEDFADVYEILAKKGDELLQENEDSILDNLGL